MTLLEDGVQMLVRNSVSFVSDNCLQSVRHRTNKILHSAWSKKLISNEDDVQCLRLWLAQTAAAIILQTFSIGNKPGEFGGQSSFRM